MHSVAGCFGSSHVSSSAGDIPSSHVHHPELLSAAPSELRRGRRSEAGPSQAAVAGALMPLAAGIAPGGLRLAIIGRPQARSEAAAVEQQQPFPPPAKPHAMRGGLVRRPRAGPGRAPGGASERPRSGGGAAAAAAAAALRRLGDGALLVQNKVPQQPHLYAGRH